MTLPGETADVRKARGAFFTPLSVARYIADWGIRTAGDRVLEPSCGEAVFLHAAVARLRQLGTGEERPSGVLDGIELHGASADEARRTLDQAGVSATVRTGDFFSFTPDETYDAVVGNPPYIRYQEFNGETRARSREAALRAGVSLSRLASSWAAFTVHASLFLRPGGRLGLVLPAELLTVNYASDVRAFLMSRFRSVRLVTFEERVFHGVLEEVVLLLADGYDPSGDGGTDHCELFQVTNATDLTDSLVSRRWVPRSPGERWMPSLLTDEAADTYTALTTDSSFGVLQDWGETTLGMVTGNNRYFALSPARVRELQLRATDLIPLSPPGSRHLRGLTFSRRQWRSMGESGAANWLFRPETPSAGAQRYITQGKDAAVDQAYKCRVRTPWWRTPYLKPADLFLTYMNADTPRLTRNQARVHHLNSVHGIYLHDEMYELGEELLATASLNSVTLLGAEMVGRAYGGGMLKIEPSEADRLPVPDASLVMDCVDDLRSIRRRVAAMLRSGRLLDAVGLVDEVVLTSTLGVSSRELVCVRKAHLALTSRRMARGRGVGRG